MDGGAKSSFERPTPLVPLEGSHFLRSSLTNYGDWNTAADGTLSSVDFITFNWSTVLLSPALRRGARNMQAHVIGGVSS